MSLYNALMEMVIDESSTLNRATFGFKIKPHQNLDETLKKHEYPGLINFYKTIKDLDDINYMRNDINSAISYCEKCKAGTIPKAKEFAAKGITTKDYDATINWYKTVAKKALNDRAKELKNK